MYITIFDLIHEKIKLTESQNVPVYIDNGQVITATKMNSGFNDRLDF